VYDVLVVEIIGTFWDTLMRRYSVIFSAVWVVGAGVGQAQADVPTFNRDIAPILWKNCAGCHRPGEIGPFSLLTYRDAAKRADFLAGVTESRRMPPWKPEPGFGSFHDEHRLSDEQIHRIAAWAEGGAPEGDPKDLKPAPKFPEGWQLGTPDLVLEVPEPFPVPANGRDIYRCFVIPIPIDTDKTVAAIEFRPGNRRVVHHALMFLDDLGQARARDAADPRPGYSTFGGPGILPTGTLGGWAPGAMPRFLPDGTGRYLRKGSDLVLQIHYHPDGKPETDRSVVGVYFTPTRARKIVAGIAVRTRTLDIPAGESRHRVTVQSEPLPVNVHAIGITPHMHYIGKEMKVVAQTADGQTVPLIWIKDWDFNWQGQYQYQKPVDLPKGSVIKVEAYYDNSEGNPANPSRPPKRVRWGEQTTDEMCLLAVQVVTDNLADLLQVVAMRGNRLGGLLAGGGVPGDRVSASAKRGARVEDDLPSVLVPERFKRVLGPYDKDGDGKLSGEEIDAMPEGLAARVRQAARRRMAGENAPAQK
jgi:Copper type II ascorbate-dependent monooxygenase, C-terminal domain